MINSNETFAYKPLANTYVWAVSTRDFFIAGNFTYDKDSQALVHKENNATNNDAVNWTTASEYYRMEYDPVEDAYAITFKTTNKINTSRTTATGYRPSESNYAAAEYANIYMFKCYSTVGDGSVGTTTHWDKVTSYNNNWLQYDNNNGNDHVFYGKCKNTRSGAGMFEFTQKTLDDGYGMPATLYFKPGADKSSWYIKATRIWPDIYISNGYNSIDSYTNSIATDVKIKSGGSAESRGEKSSAVEQETTKVLETTTDGGTVEEDKDGNILEKDKDGEIVSVKDSSGNSVDVEQYKAEHPAFSGKTDNTSSSNGSKTSSTSSNSKTGSNTSSKSGSSSKSSSSSNSSNSGSSSSSNNSSQNDSDEVEGEIPTIVVTLPDNIDDLPEIPEM